MARMWRRKKDKLESNPGERYRIEYRLEYDDNAELQMVPCGQTDTQKEIESHGASVDINNIINRFVNGDASALDAVKGFYGDVSELPLKLQDVLNINARGQELFDSLPTEQKKLYDNNYIKFVQQPEILMDYLAGNSNPQPVENPVEKSDTKTEPAESE